MSESCVYRIDHVRMSQLIYQACCSYKTVHTHTHSMIPTEVLMNKYTFDSSVKLHLSLISFLPADPSVHHRQKTVVTDMCYPTEISSLMDFGTQDCSLGKGTTLLEKIQGVALVTAGSVHSDLSWQLKDTELSA